MLDSASAKRRVRIYQTLATGAASILTTAATLYGSRYPWLIPLAVAVSSLAAKLTGKSLPSVTQDQLAHMAPLDVATLTAAAIKAMRPADTDLAVMALRASLPPQRNVDVKLVRSLGRIVQVPWDSTLGVPLEVDIVPHNARPPAVQIAGRAVAPVQAGELVSVVSDAAPSDASLPPSPSKPRT